MNVKNKYSHKSTNIQTCLCTILLSSKYGKSHRKVMLKAQYTNQYKRFLVHSKIPRKKNIYILKYNIWHKGGGKDRYATIPLHKEGGVRGYIIS